MDIDDIRELAAERGLLVSEHPFAEMQVRTHLRELDVLLAALDAAEARAAACERVVEACRGAIVGGRWVATQRDELAILDAVEALAATVLT